MQVEDVAQVNTGPSVTTALRVGTVEGEAEATVVPSRCPFALSAHSVAQTIAVPLSIAPSLHVGTVSKQVASTSTALTPPPRNSPDRQRACCQFSARRCPEWRVVDWGCLAEPSGQQGACGLLYFFTCSTLYRRHTGGWFSSLKNKQENEKNEGVFPA